MFYHYLTTALRNFRRHKITTSINLLCLAIGLLGFLGAHWVVKSLESSDRYFPHAERIFAITQKVQIPGAVVSGALPATGWMLREYLHSDLPTLLSARATVPENTPVTAGDAKLTLQVKYADPELLDIFSFNFIAGNAKDALRRPHSTVLTQNAAERLFGSAGGALGRRIVMASATDLEVTGVIGNIKRPSHFQSGSQYAFDMLVSVDVFDNNPFKRGLHTSWIGLATQTYVMLPDNGAVTRTALFNELATFAQRHVPVELCRCEFSAVPIHELTLTTMNSLVGADRTGLGARALLYVLGALVLFIACMNYANLATAQSIARAKEIGMRRVVGASRGQVIVQHLFEAALLCGAAFLVAVIIAAIALAVASSEETSFVLQGVLISSRTWLGALLLLCVTTLAAGTYPAFFLSRIKPVEAMRAGQSKTPSRFISRLLISTQFASAGFLLIAVLVMAAHNSAMKRSALGEQASAIVVIKNDVRNANLSIDALRTELLRQPHVKAVTAYPLVPWGFFAGLVRISHSADDAGLTLPVLPNRVEHDFFSTLNMQLLAGRTFDREHAEDVAVWRATTPANVVIDRALATQQGWPDPQQAIGKPLYLKGAVDPSVLPRPLQVIGVVEGRPLAVLGGGATSNVYFLQPSAAVFPIIRIDASNVTAALSEIDHAWNTLAPSVAIDRQFADEVLNNTYAMFGRFTTAMGAISLLAFVSAVLGLIGMSIYIIGRRTHEIGVRKTLGAPAGSIFILLIRDFSKPVIIANLIAWPLAFVAMRLYLRVFSDRSALSPTPFLLSMTITLLIAWLAVTAQALRAAHIKPAEVLRYE